MVDLVVSPALRATPDKVCCFSRHTLLRLPVVPPYPVRLLLPEDMCDACFLLTVWVCTAALAILDRLDVVDVSTLGWWLAERQLPNGGMNGRPEKLEDVCIFFF